MSYHTQEQLDGFKANQAKALAAWGAKMSEIVGERVIGTPFITTAKGVKAVRAAAVSAATYEQIIEAQQMRINAGRYIKAYAKAVRGFKNKTIVELIFTAIHAEVADLKQALSFSGESQNFEEKAIATILKGKTPASSPEYTVSGEDAIGHVQAYIADFTFRYAR